MPFLRDIKLNVSVEAALRRLGKREEVKLKTELRVILDELLNSLDDMHLLEPAVVYEFQKINQIVNDGIVLKNGLALNGSLLNSIFKSAKELVAIVCTIGPRLEERVRDFVAHKDPLRGLLLDGIGSAGVDLLVQKACDVIKREVCRRGYQAGSRISPGVSGFPISEQRKVFRIAGGEQIGVRLTPSLLMIPRKSLSTVIGIGADMPIWTEVERCDRCNLSRTCLYRESLAPRSQNNA